VHLLTIYSIVINNDRPITAIVSMDTEALGTDLASTYANELR